MTATGRLRPASDTACREKTTIFWRNRPAVAAGQALYRRTADSACRPGRLAALDLPDTFDARLAFLSALLWPPMRALVERADEASSEVARSLGESFVADMDRTVREAGVGDLGVARRVKALYAHLRAIHARLDQAQAGEADADRAALVAALADAFEATVAPDHVGLSGLVDAMEAARAAVRAAPDVAALASLDPYPVALSSDVGAAPARSVA